MKRKKTFGGRTQSHNRTIQRQDDPTGLDRETESLLNDRLEEVELGGERIPIIAFSGMCQTGSYVVTWNPKRGGGQSFLQACDSRLGFRSSNEG